MMFRHDMPQLSRRQFAVLATVGTMTVPVVLWRKSRPARGALTAQAIVDRIKKSVGVPWAGETVDTFKAGDPATAVTGITTTAMASLDVLRRSVQSGANLVITSEPTFFSKADLATSEPVCAAKRDFITRSNLVVWRFSDHWRRRTPDPVAQGLTDVLGWSKFRTGTDPARVSIPSTTLDALASHAKKVFQARGGIRVVGDPQTTVQTVAVLPGSTALRAALETLPHVDVIIAGELREWESVEYARDVIAAGGRKGLILLGRVLSEEPAMNVCAQWITTIVPEVKTTWLRVGDPYWRPE
jgi:putative NIF3 family GTP cyclohydrolase 1 type 2